MGRAMSLTYGSGPAVLLLSFVLAGCGTSAVSPSAVPAPSAEASSTGQTSPAASQAPSPVPSALAPSASASTGSVAINEAAIRSVAIPWPFTDPWPLAARGSRAFYLELASGKDPATGKVKEPKVYRLRVADAATDAIGVVATLAPGHMVGGFTATAERAVWVEIWYDGPPPPGGITGGDPYAGRPQHWQVVALDLAGGTRSVVASGTNHRVAVGGEAAAINPPVLAVEADRVAYTLEATAPGAPSGNKIVVRSLADGSTIRTVTTTGFVPWIGLDGNVLAYREALGANLDGATAQDARLMLATADDRAPERIDEHVASAAISGDRLVWGRTDATDASAWTTLLSGGALVHVAGPQAVGFSLSEGPGSDRVSASDGFAAWVAVGTVDGGDQTFIPFIWKVGDRTARLVTLPSSIDFVSVSDGWLTWNESDGPPRLRGIPLASLDR